MRAEAVVHDEEIGLWAGQVFFVVAFARDAEGFGQASGAAGQFSQVAGLVNLDISGQRHLLDPGDWLEGAEQHASGFSVGQAGDVEKIMIAVDEVNVSKAGRPEEDEVAGGASAEGMRGGITLAEIGFHFHDPRGQEPSLLAPHQDLA